MKVFQKHFGTEKSQITWGEAWKILSDLPLEDWGDHGMFTSVAPHIWIGAYADPLSNTLFVGVWETEDPHDPHEWRSWKGWVFRDTYPETLILPDDSVGIWEEG